MIKASRFALFACALLITPLAAAAQTEDERREAARAYIEITGGIEPILTSTLDSIASQIPEDEREDYRAFMDENLDVAGLERLLVEGLVRHFTVAELEALTEFYGSELGRSIMQKYPRYLGSVLPQIQTVVLQTTRTFDPDTADSGGE